MFVSSELHYPPHVFPDNIQEEDSTGSTDNDGFIVEHGYLSVGEGEDEDDRSAKREDPKERAQRLRAVVSPSDSIFEAYSWLPLFVPYYAFFTDAKSGLSAFPLEGEGEGRRISPNLGSREGFMEFQRGGGRETGLASWLIDNKLIVPQILPYCFSPLPCHKSPKVSVLPPRTSQVRLVGGFFRCVVAFFSSLKRLE